MITTFNQPRLGFWLCDKIGLIATPSLMCIGRENSKGELMGVVGYDGFNGSGGSIQMHTAGAGNWISRDLLFKAFHYPFIVCKAKMIIGLVPSGNVQAIKFNTKLGFRTEYELQEAHPDGSLLVMTMLHNSCRFLRN